MEEGYAKGVLWANPPVEEPEKLDSKQVIARQKIEIDNLQEYIRELEARIKVLESITPTTLTRDSRIDQSGAVVKGVLPRA